MHAYTSYPDIFSRESYFPKGVFKQEDKEQDNARIFESVSFAMVEDELPFREIAIPLIHICTFTFFENFLHTCLAYLSYTVRSIV